MVFEKKQLSKALAIALMVACAVAFMPLLNGQAFAAAKKPGKVKISSAKQVTDTMTAKITWKKAKNAKKYNVKIDGTVVKKNLKAKSYTTGDLAEGPHKVQVQGVNGKKKGKWSTKSFTIVTPVPPTPPVKVTLSDASGLQSDGTAVVGDTLQVSYEAALGTPATVTWFKDGKAVSVRTGNISAEDLRLATNVAGMGEGSYFVRIENTNGMAYTSNAIVVTKDELAAVVSGFALTDFYGDAATSTPATVTMSDTTSTSIVTFTLNKAYAGSFYLTKDSTKVYTTGNMVTVGKALPASGATKKAVADFVDKNATTDGIWCENADGSASYKFVFNAGLARGANYQLIFDQTNVDNHLTSDTATTTKTPNITAAVAEPYVTAPSKIAVTSFNNGTQTKVTVYGEDGAALTWWNVASTAAATVAGFDSMKLYNVADKEISATDKAATTTNVAVAKGVATLTTARLNSDYVYAKFATTAGVFAEKSATLTSEIAEAAVNPAASMVLSENETTATSADVTFSSLKSAGTVYILQGDATNDTFAEIAALDETSASVVASAAVDGAHRVVTVDNVFASKWIGVNGYNQYVALFVPSDEQAYSRMYAGATNSSSFVLTSKVASYAMTAKAEMTTASPATTGGKPQATTEETLYGLDQFGDEVTSGLATELTGGLAMKAASDTMANAAKPVLTVDANGVITLTTEARAAVAETESWTLTTSYGTFTLGVKTAGTTGYRTGNSWWDAHAGTEVFTLTFVAK